MYVTDLICEKSIKIGSLADSPQQVIDEMVNLHFAVGNISNPDEFKEAIMKREASSSTAIGEGIAIPHAKSESVVRPSVCVLRTNEGIEFGAPDNQKVNLFFMIAVNDQNSLHLEILSELVTILMDETIHSRLLKAKTPSEFLNIIKEFYGESIECEEGGCDEIMHSEETDGYARIVAVTACPTGIAHTYIAAEAIRKSAEELGVSVKIETRGATGTGNLLSDDDIAFCDAVIVAADKDVDLSRFDGKKVLITDVKSGVNKSSELLETALSGDIPVYRRAKAHAPSSSLFGENTTHTAYKHLMNGVSYMLPFVIGGGIMIALAFLFDTVAGMPKDADFGSHTAIAAFFMTIGNYAFGFMLPVLAGFISKSIADRPGLAIGFVGGYIASLGCTFADLDGNPQAVSGFLGALAAGFAGGYIAIGIRKLFSFLMDSVSVMIPTLFQPLIGIVLMGAFMCAVNPFIGNINTHVTEILAHMSETSRVILGFILAAMMALDMGGPLNKAAYVFGTAALANGGYNIMAAVMIGGMVPPLAVAVCCTVFKNLWTKSERKSAMINYVLGLCFITEGAIPYAAADPIRMISAFIVGSGVSGALSMMFNCTLRAPHGGIFVFPLIGNVAGYIIALAAGTAVSAVLIAAMRRGRFLNEAEIDEE